MPKCELDEVYGELLPKVTEAINRGADFPFSASTLPSPPDALSSERVICKNTQHVYNARHYVDCVRLYAEHATVQLMGMWILSMLFHENPSRSVLKLSHQRSDIKSIICEYDYKWLRAGRDVDGYLAIPTSYDYFYDPQEHRPSLTAESPYEFPSIFLTNEEDMVEFEELEARDTLLGFGHDRPTVRFAKLLLDIGAAKGADFDVNLEGELGFGGVAPGSTELQIVVPGTFRWIDIFDADCGE